MRFLRTVASIRFIPARHAQRSFASNFTIALLLVLFASVRSSYAQVNVVTNRNDNARTAQNTSETLLTPSDVNQTLFGKLFSQPVDGLVYAQPLYLSSVAIPGKGTHNIVIVATEHDGVYAFDADSNTGANAAPLWQITLLDAAHGASPGATSVPNGDVGTTDIIPEIGITGTPVIDTSTGTLYVVGKTKESNSYFLRLHALDVTTGAEKFLGPVAIQASLPGTGSGSSGGTVNFNTLWENQRPGLILLNGVIYMAFASHGDLGPWHGWVLGYNANNLQQAYKYCPSCNASGAGIWLSGQGIPSDGTYLYMATGNGPFDATTSPDQDFGDSLIKLGITNGTLGVVDYFTPFNQLILENGDQDLASGGTLLLPDQPGAHPHELIQANKEGKIYVIDRDIMTTGNIHYCNGCSSNTEIVQEIPNAIGGMWGSPTYWNNTLYFWGKGDFIKSFAVSNGLVSTSPVIGTPKSNYPSPACSVSSNGNTNGILWCIQTDASSTTGPAGPAVLYAFDATNVKTELYDSTQNSSRDNPGGAVKFQVPTIANGKVYVGAEKQISVFGLLNGMAPAATPTISPAGSSNLTQPVQVSITDSMPSSSIFYTTDGSDPTTASTPYAAAFTVSTTTTVKAIATASGFLQSSVASQTYSFQSVGGGGSPILDAQAAGDQGTASTTVTTNSFSTTAGGELLLAFISTDAQSGANTTVTGVSGGGLTWSLVIRTNAQRGTSEIWRALAASPLTNVTVTATLSPGVASSLAILSFKNVDTSGTNGSGAIGATGSANASSGAPSATLVTTRNNSWVLGVGNDYDNTIPRTPGSNQSVFHKYYPPVGDTYWMQMQNAPTPLSGTTVSINDTAPTGDRYNLSIVEVLPATVVVPTYKISGTITPVASAVGATVALTGPASASTTADAFGNYSFSGLANGNYTVTPSKAGFTFTPANQVVPVSGADVPAINFTIQPIPTHAISGTITPLTNGSGVTVKLTGAATATVTSDTSGNYSFTGLQDGSYTVTPTKTGFTFSPVSLPVALSGADAPSNNFTIASIPTYSISGNVSPLSNGVGVTLTLSGALAATTTSDSSGNYAFAGLSNGSYTVTPSKTGLSFSPANAPATINNASVSGINFTAQTASASSIAIDATVSTDGNSSSSSLASPLFSTTSANELLLAFVSTDDPGSGTNVVVSNMSGAGLTWALVARANAQRGTSEIWRAFSSAVLTNVTATATLSKSVPASITIVSFSGVDPSGTNGSGAIGATNVANASSGAPSASLITTRTNSLVLGVGNDYDNAIARTLGANQTLVHQLLASVGDTYWVQRQSALTPLSGTTVVINDTAPTGDRYNLAICEILRAP